MDSGPPGTGFQPFLRFWLTVSVETPLEIIVLAFQPFLRFWVIMVTLSTPQRGQVSTLLEILARVQISPDPNHTYDMFQPFLRFWIWRRG